MRLCNPLEAAERVELCGRAGRLCYYASKLSEGPPLLLIHSVNAAASAFEVRPLFNHYAKTRPVYAVDLPGFCLSDRSARPYTVRLMTDAIIAVAQDIRRIHNHTLDAVGLSLSCEFLGRAAAEEPDLFRLLGFISPTGFEGKARDNEPGGTRARPWMRHMLEFKLWSKQLWALSTREPVIRKFLEKTWGSKDIDEALLQFAVQTAHQPGARHAPFSFMSGYMFSTDILKIYEALTHPVWMVHGVRGDFVDYHLKTRVGTRPNWHIDILPTGAFPHFENLSLLTASYDQFGSRWV